MTRIEKIGEKRAELLEYILHDPIANGFAIEDIREMPKDGELYISKDITKNGITGYMLNHYEGSELFVTLKGSSNEDASRLLTQLSMDESISVYLHAEPKHEQIVKDFFTLRKREFEETNDLLMTVSKNSARLVSPNLATIIPKKYARDVAMLITHGASDEAKEIISLALDQKKIWGIIVDGHVVSIAGIASRQPEIGIIVNVATDPNFRRRGYGTMATSAATESALRDSEIVSLFVNVSNIEAIRIYEKLGYKVYANSITFKAKSK